MCLHFIFYIFLNLTIYDLICLANFFIAPPVIVHSAYSLPNFLLKLPIKRAKHYYKNVIKGVCLFYAHIISGTKIFKGFPLRGRLSYSTPVVIFRHISYSCQDRRTVNNRPYYFFLIFSTVFLFTLFLRTRENTGFSRTR